MKFFKIRDLTQSMILADGVYFPLHLTSSLNNNVMLVGASGQGKTRQHIKANIMQMNCNYVISDSSGRLVRELGSMLKKNGYSVQVMNFADPLLSENYNPMFYLHKESDVLRFVEDLMHIYDGNHSDGNPRVRHGAKALLCAICWFLISECNKEDQTFAGVLKLLDHLKAHWTCDDSALDIMFKDLAERAPEHYAVKQFAVFQSFAYDPEIEERIIQSALFYVQRFDFPELTSFTAQNTIKLNALSQCKSAIFIIPSDSDRSKDWLCRIFYNQLFDVLFNTEKKLYHVHFFFDDFLFNGKISDFDEKLSMFRSHSLSATVVLQDEVQLEQIYGLSAARSIISNCTHYIFMGSNNIDLCNKAAERAGQCNITGDSLLRMDSDSCLVVSGPQIGIHKKYNLEKHPQYQHIIDNPQGLSMEGKFHDLLFDIEQNLSIFKVSQLRDRTAERQRKLIVPRPLSQDLSSIQPHPSLSSDIEEIEKQIQLSSKLYHLDPAVLGNTISKSSEYQKGAESFAHSN